MKNILTICAILFSLISSSQETVVDIGHRENTGFFNITKIGYIKAYEIKRDRFVPGVGGFFSEPETSSTGARSSQTINGFFLSPEFSIGLGVGLDSYRNPTANTLPVFLDVRLYFNEDGNSLFVFTDAGATVRIGGENSSLRRGGLFNLGGGYKFSISHTLSLVSEVFLAHKSISLTEEGLEDSNDIIRITGLGFSFGILF